MDRAPSKVARIPGVAAANANHNELSPPARKLSTNIEGTMMKNIAPSALRVMEFNIEDCPNIIMAGLSGFICYKTITAVF